MASTRLYLHVAAVTRQAADIARCLVAPVTSRTASSATSTVLASWLARLEPVMVSLLAWPRALIAPRGARRHGVADVHTSLLATAGLRTCGDAGATGTAGQLPGCGAWWWLAWHPHWRLPWGGLGASLGFWLWLSHPQPRPPLACAEQSLYEVLGVDRNASEQEIKKAYKRSAVKNHPDKAPESERPVYEERFKRISRAYEILSDPEKRRVYDQHGEAAFDGRDAGGGGGFPGAGGFQAGPGVDPFDMFRNMFGGGFGGGNFVRRTPDVGYALGVTLEEIYVGCTRDLRYEQDVVCRRCHGRGATRLDRCRSCHGSGVTVTVRQVGPGMVQQFQRPCADCGGHGATVPPGAICSDCRGAGMLQQQVEIPVQVPRGCANRHRFVFKGKADEAPDMETGDIIVEVQEKEHETFKRLGADLLVERRVSLLDALCGVRFSVRHLDGSDMEICCKEGEVVRPGDVWVIRERGMPQLGRPGRFGDLIVRFEVDFPTTLPAHQQGDTARLREQLRPLIDPKAPAEPPGAGAGRPWSKIFGGGAEAAPFTANRAETRRKREVEEQLAARERERVEERGSRRGGGGGVDCAQM